MTSLEFQVLAVFIITLLVHLLLEKFLPDEPFTFADKAISWLVIASTIILAAGVWLVAVKNSQFAPHHITGDLNGKLVCDFWTTNPVHIVYQTQLVPTINGLQFKDVPVTNYYWHVWSIFKK